MNQKETKGSQEESKRGPKNTILSSQGRLGMLMSVEMGGGADAQGQGGPSPLSKWDKFGSRERIWTPRYKLCGLQRTRTARRRAMFKYSVTLTALTALTCALTAAARVAFVSIALTEAHWARGVCTSPCQPKQFCCHVDEPRTIFPQQAAAGNLVQGLECLSAGHLCFNQSDRSGSTKSPAIGSSTFGQGAGRGETQSQEFMNYRLIASGRNPAACGSSTFGQGAGHGRVAVAHQKPNQNTPLTMQLSCQEEILDAASKAPVVKKAGFGTRPNHKTVHGK